VPIINDIRNVEPDLLVTLGGGSLSDGAKVIVYAVVNGVQTVDDLDRLYQARAADGTPMRDRTGVGNEPTLPIVFIPTTLSAGEFSCYGGSTNPVTLHKRIMKHPKMFARLVILDPVLTLTTPQWVWISTGVRAIDHCVESLCSNDPLSKELLQIAERSLATLAKNLLLTVKDPSQLQPRLDCAIAAGDIAGNLLLAPQVSVGASHGIGHQLGPLGVGHGQTSCVMLPAVLRFNLLHSPPDSDQAEKQDRVKRAIWDSDPTLERILTGEGGLDRDSADVSMTIRGLFNALDMPGTLKAVGVDRSHFDALAVNSLDDVCTAANPVPLKKEDILEILESVAE
jgi:alcohol dehydrogenase class IV